jgi:hypothetical protein
LRKTAQKSSERDAVVDAGIQQVEDPSEPYGADNWDNQRAGVGTVVGGAGFVHEVAEQYREVAQVGVVTDTLEVGGRHSKDFRVKEEGACKTVNMRTA